MKGIISCILSTLVFSILILSCDKEDDNPPFLVGIWQEMTTERSGCNNAANNYSKQCAATNNCETWKFNADLTFSRTSSAGAVNDGSYILVGNKITLCYTACVDYNYALSGNVLTITEMVSSDCSTKYVVTRN